MLSSDISDLDMRNQSVQAERKTLVDKLKINILNKELSLEEQLGIERYIFVNLFFFGEAKKQELENDYRIICELGFIRDEFKEIYCDLKKPEALVDFVKINKLDPSFLRLVTHNIASPKKFKRLGLLSKQQFFNFTSQIFHYPELCRIFLPEFARLINVCFGAEGLSNDRWSYFASEVVKQSELYKHHPTLFLEPKKIKYTGSSEFKLDEIKEVKSILGRTILFETKDQTFAVKIEKRGEDVDALNREYATAAYLQKYSKVLGLKSFIHTPKAVIKIENLRTWLQSVSLKEGDVKKLENLVDLDKANYAYIYAVPNKNTGCFIYLHNPSISEQAFFEANRIIVNDLMKLLQYGFYFHQLADLFHTSKEVAKSRPDRGRYRTLVNLINQYFYGKGRLHDWLGSIEYVNVRLEGLVDWGDWIPLANLFNNENDFVRAYYSQPSHTLRSVFWRPPNSKIGNISLINAIAEYLFVLELCAGRRGRFLTQQLIENNALEKDIKQLWLKLANQLVENGAQAIAVFCNIPEYRARELLSPWINLDHLAEQMWFWMTNKNIKFICDDSVERIILPKTLYGEDVTAISEFKRYESGTLNKDVGCSVNGKDPDLGPVNGQYPIKEGDKLLYMVGCIIHTVINQADIDADNLRKEIKFLREGDYKNAQLAFSGIVGLNKHLPKLNLQALHEIKNCLREVKALESKESEAIEMQLIKQQKFHSDQIGKFYGSKWLSFYRNKKVNKMKCDESKSVSVFDQGENDRNFFVEGAKNRKHRFSNFL